MEEVWTAGEGGEEGELFTGINFHNYSPPPGNIIYKAGGRGALHGIYFHNYSPPPGNIIYKAGGRGALHWNILPQLQSTTG